MQTIRKAHRIYVLSNGRVIEQGTHETLMSQEGSQYREMMKAHQTEQTEEENEDTMSLEQLSDDDEKLQCKIMIVI